MFLPTLYALVCFTVAAGVSGKNVMDDEFYLEWPEKYSLSATRISLTSGIVENYKAWKTNTSSRVDYNDGLVKTIVESVMLDYPEGVKYEVHPETTDGEIDVIKCSSVDGQMTTLKLESILPESDEFEFVDFDPINDKDTIKFYYKESKEGKEIRHTLWVEYVNETDTMVPVRYEEQVYNEWLGYLNKHNIWDFFDFNTEFENDVFDVEQYECDEEESIHSESVTKHLLFMDPDNNDHVDHVFNAFKTKYNSKYADEREHAMRKSIFQQKMSLIKSTNRKNVGYKLAVNQFTDRTPEELKRYRGLKRRPEGKSGNIPFPYTEAHVRDLSPQLPKEYDLRLLGLVTWVKNQESCGSCWTFGTTAAVEGALARINGGKLITLANQALVDCVWPFGAAGCEGGSDNAAYEWMMHYGLPTEVEYGPYVNEDGLCNIANMSVTYPILGYTDVTPYSVGALKVAIINHGPLSVSVHVTDAFFQYSGGIFYDIECTPTALNHEIALVGYGEKDGETFWIVKNSWGPKWGIGGYMYISARDNNCGIATEPTYVTMKSV